MKNFIRICTAVTLFMLGVGCAALEAVGHGIESIGRGLATGSGALVLGAIGWLFGPLGAAIGVLAGGCITYLFEEHAAVQEFAEKVASDQAKIKAHREVVHEASGFAWQLILLVALVGLLLVYFKHKDFRTKVNSMAVGAWGTFRSWFSKLVWKKAKNELQQADPGRTPDSGSGNTSA